MGLFLINILFLLAFHFSIQEFGNIELPGTLICTSFQNYSYCCPESGEGTLVNTKSGISEKPYKGLDGIAPCGFVFSNPPYIPKLQDFFPVGAYARIFIFDGGLSPPLV
ncbi:MAG: hypothetical protein JXB34_03960 [Bacteroidales bacterium]|nr:hypothetical protein [Bacteroidales bacterium]